MDFVPNKEQTQTLFEFTLHASKEKKPQQPCSFSEVLKFLYSCELIQRYRSLTLHSGAKKKYMCQAQNGKYEAFNRLNK